MTRFPDRLCRHVDGVDVVVAAAWPWLTASGAGLSITAKPVVFTVGGSGVVVRSTGSVSETVIRCLLLNDSPWKSFPFKFFFTLLRILVGLQKIIPRVLYDVCVRVVLRLSQHAELSRSFGAVTMPPSPPFAPFAPAASQVNLDANLP